MLEGFYCPDGVKVKLDDCFKECRLGERCLTLPTLTLMAQEREWNGVASTTQLIDGTMLTFLKVTKSYYVDPDSRAFMLAGTRHHKSLEEAAKELGLAAEIPLSVDRDIFDLIEFEGKQMVMTDYKLWGSYRVAKALGIVEIGKEPDPSGAVYKTSGKWGKAGDPKMVPIFQRHPDQVDNWEAEFQLNRYRVMLGELGFRIDKMQLQVTVRDGGLAIAKSRGVMRNTYKIPIPTIQDIQITNYFTYKNDVLMDALDKGEWSMPCTPKECWEGARCQEYCDVWEHCPKGRLEHGG